MLHMYSDGRELTKGDAGEPKSNCKSFERSLVTSFGVLGCEGNVLRTENPVSPEMGRGLRIAGASELSRS